MVSQFSLILINSFVCYCLVDLVELLKIDDPLERSFYQNQILIEKWSIPELRRQKKSSLFLRLAASKDKEGILQLATKGQVVQQPLDLMREPYILDFLKIPEPYHLSETELEAALLNIYSISCSNLEKDLPL
ncbi:MAG: hypothetical protein ACTHK0_05115 [Ginsengibacter sp.]